MLSRYYSAIYWYVRNFNLKPDEYCSWFQNNGASAHTSNDIKNFYDEFFNDRLIQ